MTETMTLTAHEWRDILIENCFPHLLSFDGIDILRHGCEWVLQDTRMTVRIDPALGDDGAKKIRTFIQKSHAHWPSIVDFNFEWWDKYPLAVTGQHLTDYGNAQRLAARHGTDLRYCYPWKDWLVWDGRRWRRDASGEALRRAQETAISIYAEATEGHTREERKQIARWADRSESTVRLRAMLEQARALLPVEPEKLDAHPWLLITNDGVLDLKTGKLLMHDPDLYVTRLAPVDYDPDAEAPYWLKFLGEIMADDENMIAFLQRAIGYSLTGDTSERIMFLLHGRGDNGKTTFLEVIRALLGDYAQRIPTETLLATKRSAGSATPDIARLRGARFVSASESEEGRRLAEAAIKDLTGGDTVTARFLYSRGFDFKPECKIWLATNHKPEIRGTDRAIWNRLRLIPFSVTIPEERQDKHLADKLKEELPGILAWAIEGCLAWQSIGLGVADKVKAATSAYRSEEDVLGGFIEDCCVEGDDKKALASQLYEAYKKWGGDLSQRRFGLALGERGFDKKRKTDKPHKGRIFWRGLGLMSEPSEPSEPSSNKVLYEGGYVKSSEKKLHQGSLGSPDDPLVKAAEDLGGEVVKVETADGEVEVPF